MKRPLVWVAASWATGIFAASRGWLPGLWVPLALCVAGLVLAIACARKPQWRPLSLVLCFLGAGALLWTLRHAGPPGDPLSRQLAREVPETAVLEGTVRRATVYFERATRLEAILDVDRLDAGTGFIPVSGRAKVFWQEPAHALHVGDRVRVAGRPRGKLGMSNPGIYDPDEHNAYAQTYTGLVARGTQAVTIVRPGPWWSPMAWASRAREVEARWMAYAIPESIRPFIFAVWLGDQSQVPQAQYDRYKYSGTAHLLSVSGVHVAIIYASTLFVLKLFLRRGRLRALLAMFIVMSFALVTGASITSLRAALMVCIYLIAELADREPDTPTALSLAGIVFMAFNPDLLFHIGFQLSFTSVASILIFTPLFEELLARVPYALRETIAVSLGVQILSIPLSAYYFHMLPAAGPLVNLVTVPLVTVVLWLCFLTVSAACFSMEAAAVFGHAMLPAVFAIDRVSEWGAGIQRHMPMIPAPTLAAGICFSLGVLLAAGIRRAASLRHPALLKAGAAALLILAVVFWRPGRGRAEIVFLDVGHGDATFVRSPEGRTALIDSGDRSGYANYAATVVTPYLMSQGRAHIDHLFLTHTDRDHMGGAPYLIDTVEVGEVFLGPLVADSELEGEVLARCAARAVPVRRIASGQRFDLGGATLEALHPPQNWTASQEDNECSLVLRLEWEGVRVLLPGDIQSEGEAAVAGLDCRAEILKVPHHGSHTSSSDAFIDAVAPAHAIISTGGKGGREAVAEDVLKRYQDRGIQVWRTDVQGGIRLRVAQGAIIIEPTRRIPDVPPRAQGATR
ncbi:MAG: DNA internalization-related competence protein ComEC/Rec2 [Candidatus Hydrogenedentes bacterium]|nr:DNA internalization-related competence protein ComEC/Rec2 [Candidatus Hydrogenedentota bacterium]